MLTHIMMVVVVVIFVTRVLLVVIMMMITLWLPSISTSLKVRMLLVLHLLLAMWRRVNVSLRRDKLCVFA